MQHTTENEFKRLANEEVLNPPNKERWHGDGEDPAHHSPEGGLDNPFWKGVDKTTDPVVQ